MKPSLLPATVSTSTTRLWYLACGWALLLIPILEQRSCRMCLLSLLDLWATILGQWSVQWCLDAAYHLRAGPLCMPGTPLPFRDIFPFYFFISFDLLYYCHTSLENVKLCLYVITLYINLINLVFKHTYYGLKIMILFLLSQNK